MVLFDYLERVRNFYKDTLAELRDVYLRDTRMWIIMVSMGKDSTCVLNLVWEMLSALPKDQRTKAVHIVISDTRVEAPEYFAHIKSNFEQIQREAVVQELPIVAHLAEPALEDRFFSQVLGFGNVPPNEKSSYRWCTDKLKISSTDSVVKRIMAERMELDEFDAVMLLGVREEESSRRSASIKKHAIDETKFARNVVHKRCLVYHPIKDWTTDDVWNYLLNRPLLGWGADPHALFALYQNADGECPLTSTDGRQSSTCGGSRFGCWTCCFNGPNDKMLQNLAEHNNHVTHLIRWKKHLYLLRNDARYRLPLRKRVHKKVQFEYDEVKLDFEGDVTVWNYQPGPLTIVARKALLEGLLHIQENTGYSLIDEEEIQFILSCWSLEGVSVPRDQLKVAEFQLDGHIALKPNGQINEKETTYSANYAIHEFDVTPDILDELQRKMNMVKLSIIVIPSKDRRKVLVYQLA